MGRGVLNDAGQPGEISVKASSDSSMPATPTMVSQAGHVRNGCGTLRPRKSFTIQKPESLRWERKSDPQPIAVMISATWLGVNSGGGASTGTSRPAAVVIATVADPVATRMNTASSQP